jgi:hypothetical protein
MMSSFAVFFLILLICGFYHVLKMRDGAQGT